MATVDVFRVWLYIIANASNLALAIHTYIIQREASALLFLLRWAMREPLHDGRAIDTGFHAFFINYYSILLGEPAGFRAIILYIFLSPQLPPGTIISS